MKPKEMVRRLDACLSEAGYPGCVRLGQSWWGRGVTPEILSTVPYEVISKAARLVGQPIRCGSCWKANRACSPDDHADGCTRDAWEIEPFDEGDMA